MFLLKLSVSLLALANPTANQDKYQELVDHFKEVGILSSISGLVHWEQETYMPPGGIELRAKQNAYLAGWIHRKVSDPIIGKKLNALIDLATGQIYATNLSDAQIATLKAWRRDYNLVRKENTEFTEKLSALTSQSVAVWANAKKTDDFAIFAPKLTEMVDAMREKASLLGYENHPYNALLDLYEPGMTVEKLDLLFAKIKEPIVNLIRHRNSRALEQDIFIGNFDEKRQLALCRDFLQVMGIDLNRARLDRTSHPFTSGTHPSDVRLTTFENPEDMRSIIFSTIHEGGHGLYEQGLPEEHFGTPLAQSISLGIHESQSRFWETRIALTRPFWEHFYPKVQADFPGHFQNISLDEFYAALNHSCPSFVRVEADELTYTLHIILRYELEKELIEGSLSVRDLPARWNAKMVEYLGIEPPTDTLGCLQDIHWSFGLFGYFPTYALGNLYAAQFFNSFVKEHPNWEARVRAGDMHFIRDYLKEIVHKHGRRYSAEEVVQRATGEALNPDYYIQHLQSRYAP